jgi:uncharacterized RDD family membrane protein YckC
MADEWFYAQQGRQLGPVTLESLGGMLRDGRIAPSDLVWRQGMGNWVEARGVPELGPHAPVAPAPLIGAPEPLAGVRQVQYLTPRGMQWEYAGFWLRFVAWIIDYFVLLIPSMILSVATGLAINMPVFRPRLTGAGVFGVAGSQNLLAVILWWLYYALMESSVYQASLGKMALGLIVTDEAGNRLTFARATGRTFAKYVCYVTIGIGYILAGFTERKQGLHDMIARCLVVRKDVNRV